jgi:aromatic ring-opening dioxygenase LigB subunit
MGVVFGCIAPHGWTLVPLFGAPDSQALSNTRAALAELGRRVAAAQPQTIVVVEPHGLLVERSIALLDSAAVAGGTRGPEREGATPHGFSMRFAVDRPLVAAIADEAQANGVPVLRLRNSLEVLPLAVEYGTLVPLWFLGSVPQIELVVATIDRGVSRDHCLGLGRAIRAASERTGRRVALVASADLSHAHGADGPFGYDPAATDVDAAIVEAARAGALERLRELEPALARRAMAELTPVLALAGALEVAGFRGEVLSYEVPSYYGMACAAFAPSGGTLGRAPRA